MNLILWNLRGIMDDLFKVENCSLCGDGAKAFCGISTDGEECWVECMTCHAQTAFYKTKSEAITHWNTRFYFNDTFGGSQ